MLSICETWSAAYSNTSSWQKPSVAERKKLKQLLRSYLGCNQIRIIALRRQELCAGISTRILMPDISGKKSKKWFLPFPST